MRGWDCHGGVANGMLLVPEPRLDLVKHRTWPHRTLPPGREITFKTDPEKGDYELETGASRNFESWTDKQATEKEHKEARYEEYFKPGLARHCAWNGFGY